MLTGMHKTQTMVSALTFLERYHKDGDEFLDHIVRATAVETRVSSVNVGTKEQLRRGCTCICQTSRISLNKRCLPARKLMATIFWDRRGVLMAEFM
jgi:hypothetical protein